MRGLSTRRQREDEPRPQEAFAATARGQSRYRGLPIGSDSIDFAIVQRDNEYSLTHNFFGEETVEGTAFMDQGNCIYPLDEHLLIHGHNMRDGSVFGDIDLSGIWTFSRETRSSATSTPSMRIALYVPIAVFDISATPGDQDFVDMQDV